MKGILLVGGTGSRLFPLTLVTNKHLQAVFDKPMVYYPLVTLMECGVRELCIISTQQDAHRYQCLLGDGAQWGISIEYRTQPIPAGIAQSFVIARDFIGKEAVCLILGDNIFHNGSAFRAPISEFKTGATIFGCEVDDPTQFGVVEISASGSPLSIEEKPKTPKSNYAVPGLYLFDNAVVAIAQRLTLSNRAEFEITDISREYLRRGQLAVHRLVSGFAWWDVGTASSLHDAASYVQTVERKQGIKIGCPEEVALRCHYISRRQFDSLLKRMPPCDYRDYLRKVGDEAESR